MFHASTLVTARKGIQFGSGSQIGFKWVHLETLVHCYSKRQRGRKSRWK